MTRPRDDFPNRGGRRDFGERAYRLEPREDAPQRRKEARGLSARLAGAGAGRSGRVSSAAQLRTSPSDFIRRRNWLQFFGAIAVVVIIARLAWVQLVVGPDLSAAAQEQRTVEVVDAARRGAILDRNGAQLAFTMEARSITVHPKSLRKLLDERHQRWPEDFGTFEERTQQIATELPKLLGVKDLDEDKANDKRRRQSTEAPEELSVQERPAGISSSEILKKLRDSESTYQVLVRNVDPDKAQKVVDKFSELVSERQDIRQYPNGATGANIIGKIGMDGVGQFGFEASRDARLQGINGGKTIDIAQNGVAIPGSTRNVHPAVDGTTYELTLDLDMQYFVQQQLNQAKANSGAKNASAVVLDAKTGEVLAMAQADTANPNRDIGKEVDAGRTIGNSAVSNPFEPGSVAKIITAAAAIEDGVTKPDEVLQVPGSIEMSGVTVRDAWEHGTEGFTTTGVFGKSSNVGTLMLAQRLGQDASRRCSTFSGWGSRRILSSPASRRGSCHSGHSGPAERSRTCRSGRAWL